MASKKSSLSLASTFLTFVIFLSGCGGSSQPTPTPLPFTTAPSFSSAVLPQPIASIKAQALSSAIQAQSGVVDATALFDWAEIKYPELFATGPKSQTSDPYFYRFYPRTGLYLGVQDQNVLLLGPATDNKIVTVGQLGDFTCSVFPEVCLAPIAAPGLDQSTKTGAVVSLNAAASYAPAGGLLTYKWIVTKKPVGSLSTPVPSNAVSPKFTPDLPGSYQITLVVNDSRSDSIPVSINVIASQGNSAPTALPGQAAIVPTGRVVNLDGSASNDIDGDVLSFKWVFVEKPTGSNAVLANPTSSKPNFLADITGVYKVSLIVNDGKLDSPAAEVVVTATSANIAPVAAISGAQTVTTGSFVYLSGAGSLDANGDPLTYQWSFLTRPSGSTSSLSSTTSISPYFNADIAGNYVVYLTVSNGKAASQPVGITVTAAGTPTTPTRTCCRICTTGKACGDSCISRTYSCRAGGGCAC